MIDDKYLTEKEMNKEHLMTLTKEELVTRLLGLNVLRLELVENLDECHAASEGIQKRNNQLRTENKELVKKTETLWKIIQKCLDFEDMLDDLEDTAEEIREAAASLGIELKKTGEEDD